MMQWMAMIFGVILWFSSGLATAEAVSPEDLEAAYLRGEYGGVVASGEEILKSAKANDPSMDRVWYLLGMSKLQLQEPLGAKDAFLRVIKTFPESHVRADAQVGLADALWQAGDPKQAVLLYQKILKQWGGQHRVAARVQLQVGRAAQAAGLWGTSRRALEEVVRVYPTSFEAEVARGILQQADFAYAVQVGAFSLKTNAQKLQKRLAQKGYRVSVVPLAFEEGRIYRVRVGPFQSEAEAHLKARRLEEEGLPAKVVP